MKSQRRSALKKLFVSAFGMLGAGLAAKAATATSEAKTVSATPEEKETFNATPQQDIPMFSGATKLGNLLFIAGKGAHVEPFEIKAHTEIVLKELEKELINAGSSMKKVLKVNVYLNDIADFQGMNEVYKGRFGDKPPVRTTVAVAKGGVPGNSLVEMDCIAFI